MTLLVGTNSSVLHMPAEEGDYAKVTWCNQWWNTSWVREATAEEEETLRVCSTCITRKRLGKKASPTDLVRVPA